MQGEIDRLAALAEVGEWVGVLDDFLGVGVDTTVGWGR